MKRVQVRFEAMLEQVDDSDWPTQEQAQVMVDEAIAEDPGCVMAQVSFATEGRQPVTATARRG